MNTTPVRWVLLLVLTSECCSWRLPCHDARRWRSSSSSSRVRVPLPASRAADDGAGEEAPESLARAIEAKWEDDSLFDSASRQDEDSDSDLEYTGPVHMDPNLFWAGVELQELGLIVEVKQPGVWLGRACRSPNSQHHPASTSTSTSTFRSNT